MPSAWPGISVGGRTSWCRPSSASSARAACGARPCAATVGVARAPTAIAFRALGFRTSEASDESLGWLGEAFLGWALRNGRSFADPEMIAELGAELPRVMRANPLVEVPADVLLVGRVMGLLSGIGKQLGAHVDLAATLLPYLAAGTARPQA